MAAETTILESTAKISLTKPFCYHCGDECNDDSISRNEKVFCCNGCKTVFELLEGNNLCDYYSIDGNPGTTRKYYSKRNYEFLDDEDLVKRLIEFTNGIRTNLTFDIPQMHCSSCIWILENLHKLDAGLVTARVNFLQKKLFITFLNKETTLRKLVELLDSIGYEPLLNLEVKIPDSAKSEYKNLYYKIGIAGFCFGNIMLLSFPEYLSINVSEHEELKRIFAYLNIVLALPAFFYSSNDYFISAWKGLRKKIINIDVPLALGILVLFLRSIIDIAVFHGSGFLDSLAGLIFFLLIGKLFQNKTYETINFERNYKSYFPISVTIRKENSETTIPVEKLSVGDRIIIRNSELIPADSILIKGSGNIDYGFVTGEAIPTSVQNGEMVYAGGKQVGSVIELETIKGVSQSYLTQLWNSKAFKKNKEEISRIVSFSNTVSKYFTIGVITLAASAWFIWSANPLLAFNAATAVLIVACPCALALSTPFTLGNTLRIFGKNKFFLKNTHVIEELASIDSIVFDKTGTITENGSANVSYSGSELTEKEKSVIKTVTRNSLHPLSIAIFNSISSEVIKGIDHYEEFTGKGIHAVVDGVEIKLGSQSFVNDSSADSEEQSSRVFVSVNQVVKGAFTISNKYRAGLKELVSSVEKDYEISLLSGDNESEKENLRKFFGHEIEFHFKQSPHNKLKFIEELQNKNKKVLMIGDGLNDAGALKQSDVGISISDDTNNFSPACDGILDSEVFNKLKIFIAFCRTSKKIIVASFVVSFIYNIIGLTFAFSGTLSPLIAAILMPISSISAVVFTTLATNIAAKRKGLL